LIFFLYHEIKNKKLEKKKIDSQNVNQIVFQGIAGMEDLIDINFINNYHNFDKIAIIINPSCCFGSKKKDKLSILKKEKDIIFGTGNRSTEFNPFLWEKFIEFFKSSNKPVEVEIILYKEHTFLCRGVFFLDL